MSGIKLVDDNGTLLCFFAEKSETSLMRSIHLMIAFLTKSFVFFCGFGNTYVSVSILFIRKLLSLDFNTSLYVTMECQFVGFLTLPLLPIHD